MSELFGELQAAGPVAAEVDDASWVRAMLDAEAALAHALATAGLLEAGHAERIALVCRDIRLDPAELGRAATGPGNPAAPLVRALTAEVGGEAARGVHLGATSQDVLDTATMLVTARALRPLRTELESCADAAALLATEHATTVHVGRTLGQQALPVTFGHTAAGWLAGLDAAAGRLAAVRPAAQLGGACGTLASLGEHGPAVLAAFSRELELAEPDLPWHTERSRIAELAAALGQACGAVARIAGSVVLLAQSEVGELHEEGPAGSGGSSTMPHKRNPVAAISALACARQAPGLVATLLAAMEQEHQRAAGAWHAEWRPLAELLRATGSAVHWLRACFDRLRVDPERMRAHVGRGGGVLLAERVTTELAPHAGRLAAHDAVAACCRRALDGEGELADLLAADPLVGGHLDGARIRELLDPDGYLGSAAEFVRRAVAAHERRKAGI